MYSYLDIGVAFLADHLSKGRATVFLVEHGINRLNRLLRLRETSNLRPFACLLGFFFQGRMQ